MATKKNLFKTFNEEDSFSPSEDAIKVFLRLKPTNNTSDVIQVLDSKTILFKMPQEFMQARNKLNMKDQYKYSFSHIYQADTTQSQIYTGCVAPLIKDLFNGQNCLLFTYGTTNAGKTFTVLGTGDNPGIIPRTLTTLFKSIAGKEYQNDKIMPDEFNSTIEVSDETLQEERKFKEKILSFIHNKSHPDSRLQKTQSTVRSSVDEIFGESVFKEMQKRLTNDTSIIEYASDSDDRFSVWVSFMEIYNEGIYDLLQPVIPNGKRKPLKLRQDRHKNCYIEGLKHVFVRSEEEAYEVLMFGEANLQVAATGMNSRSSRSHCIFTVKLIKTPNVESPEPVVVSSFSICDLAGAERQKKTLNEGLRLKESQNINCSLHVLSRCFTTIRENQMNRSMEQKIIPFRDSKLTQLFKHALTGKESVTMIVNINSDHQLCEGTQNVLKASAIAKHIVVQPGKANLPKRESSQSMSSHIVKHNRSTLIPWDSCVKPKALEAPPTDVEDSQKSEQEQKQEQYEFGEDSKMHEMYLALENEMKEKLQDEEVVNQIEEIESLKAHIENMKFETDEKFNYLAKEHEEEISKLVEDYDNLLKVCDKNIRTLNEQIKNQQENLNSLREKLNRKTTEAESYKMELEKNTLVKDELESKVIKLTKRVEELDNDSVKTNDLKSKCQSLQEALEVLTNERKKSEEEYRSEISTLEQSCKQQLQESEKENEKLTKELSVAKDNLADSNKSLKNKEHELECCRNKMMGYKKVIRTLQSEFEVQKKDLLEYKKMCEDQKETIINMEKELNSLQLNQKEIIDKYEDNLKKTKEENESLKKEVARVTTTFYKSTPTPKEHLEKQIEEQKNQIEDLKMQLEEKEATCEKLLKASYHSKGAIPRNKTTKSLAVESDLRERSKSCEEEPSCSSELEIYKKAKSTHKYYFPSSRDLGDSEREPAVPKQPTPIDLSSKSSDMSDLEEYEDEAGSSDPVENNPEEAINKTNAPNVLQDEEDPDIFPQEEDRGKKNYRTKRKKVKSGRSTKKTPWSNKEKTAVLQFFQDTISKKIGVKKVDAERCMVLHPCLKGRTWLNIRDFVRNHIRKIK